MKPLADPEKAVEQPLLWTNAVRRWSWWLGGLFGAILIYLLSWGPASYVNNRWGLPRTKNGGTVLDIYTPIFYVIHYVPSIRDRYLSYLNWWANEGTWAARRAAGTEEIYKAFE